MAKVISSIGDTSINRTSELINDGENSISRFVEEIDLAEQVPDVIGNALTDTSTIDFTYNDIANTITADVKPNSISSIQLADNINISEFVNDAGYELTSNKGLANGYASLDGGGKVPVNQLPNSVMEYKGVYNASTNTPILVDGVGNTGDVYRTTVAGAGVNGLNFVVGDYATYNGTTWEKAHSGADNVTSVFGRLGTVVAQNGDYTASQITNVPSGNISSTTVQAALNELDTEKAIDANVVHKTGNETISNGTKTFNTNTGNEAIIVNTQSSGSNGLRLNNTSTITGASNLYSSNTSAAANSYGIYSNNSTIGSGIYSDNSSTGTGIWSLNSSTGAGIVSQGSISSTGFLYIGKNNLSDTFTVDKFGTVTGTSFIKSGATTSNILLAGGADIPQSTFELSANKQNSLNVDGTGIKFPTVDAVNNEFDIVQSTGILWGGQLSVNADPTKFNITAGEGYIVNSTDFSNITRVKVTWSASTGNTVNDILTQPVTFIMINSDGTIHQQTTFPTSQEKRSKIFVGRLNHSNLSTITFTDTFPDILQSPMSQYFDLVDAIGSFSYQGNVISPNGVNLSINKSYGKSFFAGLNYAIDNQSINNIENPGITLATFRHQNQNSTDGSNITVIDPTSYDVGGVTTPVPNPVATATAMRVYLFPSNTLRIQRGQATYVNLAAAVSGYKNEAFVENPTNIGFAVWIATIIVQKNCTSLQDTSTCKIIVEPKFGGSTGAAGVSTSTLQSAYNNSTVPQIITSSTLGAFTIQRGSAADFNQVFTVRNGVSSITYAVRGDGNVGVKKSPSSYPLDIGGTTFAQINAGSSDGMMSMGANNLGQFNIHGGRDINGNYSTTNAVRVSGIDGRVSINTIGGVTPGTPYNPIERVLVTETGKVILNNNILSDTGEVLQVTGNGKFTSDLTANSFIKSGATATNILLAGGTDIPQSTFAPASGSSSYIQNQNTSAQSANMWISGNGRFNGELLIDDGVNGRLTLGTGAAQNDIHSTTTAFGAYKDLRFTATKFLFNLGNVGIGTTNPYTKLTVAGDFAVGNADVAIGSVGSFLQINQGASSGNVYSQIRAYQTGGNDTSNLVLQTNGGNVGIGTTNPEYKLSILNTIGLINATGSATDIIGSITFKQTNSSGFELTKISTIQETGNIYEGALLFSTNTTGNAGMSEKMRISSGGNVGIGTTNPLKKLEVNGTGQFLDIIEMTGTGAMGGGAIRFNTDGSPIGLIGSTFKHQGGGSTTDLSNYVYGNNAYSVWTNNVNRFVINGNGNVGIGTTNPIGKLSIVDTYYNSFFKDTSVNFGSGLLLSGDAGSDQFSWKIFVKNNAAGGVALAFDVSTSGVGYGADPSALTYSEKMRINSTGNVLIGTTTDNGVDKLQVNGSVGINGSVISYDNGVFNGQKAFKIEGLSEVSTGPYGSKLSLQSFGHNGSTYVYREGLSVNADLTVTIPNLAGSGTRTVVADASGNLSAPVSDESLKENIQPLHYGLNEIMKMSPVSYNFKDKEKYGDGLYLGNIAQDMEKVIPEAVFTSNNGIKGIEYSHLHAVYIKAIQELLTRIEKLENK